jgi:hypothetical protein
MVNRMIKVECPLVSQQVWANSCKVGFRCTKCGSTSHDTGKK